MFQRCLYNSIHGCILLRPHRVRCSSTVSWWTVAMLHGRKALTLTRAEGQTDTTCIIIILIITTLRFLAIVTPVSLPAYAYAILQSVFIKHCQIVFKLHVRVW